MTQGGISEFVTKVLNAAVRPGRLVALLLVATVASVVPARAQSSDTWKSVAIIGGSTAAGAYIGHKVAGRTGTYVGAATGAAVGYAIDRRRRQNNSDNNDYGYGGPYPDNGGYYGNDNPYPPDGGYYPDSQNGYPGPNGYQSNSNYGSGRSRVSRRIP